MGWITPCENCTVDAVMTPSYVGYPFRYLRQDDTDGICGVYPDSGGGLGWGCTHSDCNSGSASRGSQQPVLQPDLRQLSDGLRVPAKAVVRTFVCAPTPSPTQRVEVKPVFAAFCARQEAGLRAHDENDKAAD